MGGLRSHPSRHKAIGKMSLLINDGLKRLFLCVDSDCDYALAEKAYFYLPAQALKMRKESSLQWIKISYH